MSRRAIAAVAASASVLIASPLALMVAKGLNNGATNRCDQVAPRDAWGYTIDWKWSEFGWVCSYEDRDYSPSGEKQHIGVMELF